jgi:hypothetical protein
MNHKTSCRAFKTLAIFLAAGLGNTSIALADMNCAIIYEFRYDGDDACLSSIRPAKAEEYLKRR